MRFFDRFRNALSRYEEGVHELGAPASAKSIREAEARLGLALPDELRDFLGQWNGGYLFLDDIALYGVGGAREELARLEPTGEGWAIGRTSSSRLVLDGRGRVRAFDEETEAWRIEGSGFERWLDATMAREGCLYDRDGEFREDAFDEDEPDGLAPKTRKKRAQAAIKADPDAPAWHEEMAAIHADEAEPERAREELVRAVAGAEEGEAALASAWLELGLLRRIAGDAASVDDLGRAARASTDAGEAAYAWAQATRAARQLRPDEADAFASQALALAPTFVDEQRQAATHLLDEGDVESAMERLEIALAVAPSDEALRQLVARTRARRSLRVT